MKSAFLEPTTHQEIFLKIFVCLKYSKVRDIDDLQIRLIKYVLDLLVPALTFLFNLCLYTEVLSEKMQHTKVSVLNRSGNKDDLSNYQIIAILLVISKVLEKVISKQILFFCDKHFFLAAEQFCFRQSFIK